jgi:hypothetical protein
MEKSELIEALEDGQNELVEMLEDLPDEMMLTRGVSGDWSIKDILAHLSYWEGQLVTLLFQASRGMDKPSTVHFGKETVDEINQRWYESSQERSLELIWQDWRSVRKQTIRRVGEFGEQDLNDPKRYAWLKDEPLWQWIASQTIEHEDEHSDAIREWLDQQDSSG